VTLPRLARMDTSPTPERSDARKLDAVKRHAS
jgi:hypothetical protein